jgi:hypothetical protein
LLGFIDQQHRTMQRVFDVMKPLFAVEFVWSYLKYGRLANFVPKPLRHLDQTVQAHLSEVTHKPSLLKSLWLGSELPFQIRTLLN